MTFLVAANISCGMCFVKMASKTLLQSVDAVCGKVEDERRCDSCRSSICNRWMQCAARSSFAPSTEQECTTVLDCSGAEAKRRDCTQCAAVHLIFTKRLDNNKKL